MGSDPTISVDIPLRMKKIFRDTFQLDAEAEVSGMTVESTPNWDSIAQFSLVIAIEDSFGIRIEAEDDEKLQSFASAVAYVRQATASTLS